MKYGKLSRQLTALAGPIFIETLLVMMLGAVDTFMLSRYSDNSVAAVGVVNQLMNLVFLLFEVISLGTSILCSQYFGAKRRDKVIQVVGISLLFNLLSGLLLSLCLYFFAGNFLHMMGLRPDLMCYGLPYMKIVGGFAFLQAISLSLSASLRSANKAKYPMYVAVVVNILNIIGNYTLIFGKFGMPALGVEGAAISTSFCRLVSVTILLIILFKIPLLLLVVTILLLPPAAPLIGMLAFGNFIKEIGCVQRLSKTVENEMMNIVSILLSLGVGSQMTPEKIMNFNSIGIIILGLLAFTIATTGGLLMAKLMNLFLKEKINPLIGSAGVSAVPMAARVANKVGMEEDPSNFLLMHAMGPNVSGVIGTAIAAGVFISTYGM